MTPYLLVGQGSKGDVAIRQGNADGGVELLRTSLQKLHAAPYELLTTPLNLSLAKGLAVTGQFDEASALIEESLGQVEANGDRLYLPELLRMKARLLLQLPQGDSDEAVRGFCRHWSSAAPSKRMRGSYASLVTWPCCPPSEEKSTTPAKCFSLWWCVSWKV